MDIKFGFFVSLLLVGCTNSSVNFDTGGAGATATARPAAAPGALRLLTNELTVANGFGTNIATFLESPESYTISASGSIEMVQSTNSFIAVGRDEGSLTITDAEGRSAEITVTIPKFGVDEKFGLPEEHGDVTTPLRLPLHKAMLMPGSDMTVEQPDGKIVVVGSLISEFGWGYHVGVARYLANGKIDPTFGAGGVAAIKVAGLISSGNAVAIDKDKKVLVAGSANLGILGFQGGDSFVLRLNSDGTLDSSFADNGVFLRNFAKEYEASQEASHPIRFPDGLYSIALDADGGIVAAGIAQTRDTFKRGTTTNIDADVSFRGADALLVKLTANGELDLNFNASGFLIGRFGAPDAPTDRFYGSAAVSVRIDPNDPQNRIIVGGYIGGGCPELVDVTTRDAFVVAKYKANGILDTSFGPQKEGRVCVKVSGIAGNDDRAASLKLQKDGKIVVAGMADYSKGQFGLFRMLEDGSPDSEFGPQNDGVVLFSTAAPGEETYTLAETVAIQPDSKILVGGGSSFYVNNGDKSGRSQSLQAAYCSKPGWQVVRFLPNGKIDISFGESEEATGIWRFAHGKNCPETWEGLDELAHAPIRVKSVVPKMAAGEIGKLIVTGVNIAPGTGSDALGEGLFPEIHIKAVWP